MNTFARLLLLFMGIALSPISSPALQSLHAQFAGIAQHIDGRVGVFARVLETGDTASCNADQRYPMQSVYKFPIAMAVLEKIDKGSLRLAQKVRIKRSELLVHGHSPIRDQFPKGDIDMTIAELLRYDIAESDGTACDVLIRIAGGTTSVDRYIHSLGVRDMAIATTEQVQQGADELIQYTNWATPAAIVDLLETLHRGKALSTRSTALLVKVMAESGPGAKRLKGLLPSGTVVAHKTGTAATVNGLTRATNDAGIITLPNGHHVAIAVLVADSHAGQEDREAVIAQIARAAWDRWAR